MRLRATAATLLLAAGALGVPGAIVAPAQARPPADCKVSPGGTVTRFWPQDRLDFTRVWPVTRGKGVVVGVVDSGLNQRQPQLRSLSVKRGKGVIDKVGFDPDDTTDCYGHGTAVTSLLAAQPSDRTDFAGIAPDVTVVPIKQTNTQGDKTGTSQGIGRGIDAALDAGATVVNVSIATPTPTPELRAAVARAAKRDVVVVAAAGNDAQGANLPAYPAAYSTSFPNVVAVSAVDAGDTVGEFSESGSYVTIAAPGVKVPVLGPLTGFLTVDGTSFATPYVAGTAALVRAAHPGLTARQVRDRLTATADAPPATVPSRTYGYGIVNPYLAVTSVREAAAPAVSSGAAQSFPAPPQATAPDHHLRDVALASAFALLGLAVLAVVGAVVLRRRPGRPARG
ncbi:type VII secretion-associated serine protease mycosin [Jatrophihabitans endophyticus]|uniref:Type VII secretion-associated serine protease mycosin n=1 Tax=Jatrophihabitans endophyticus TaxID=1206085 RepID=A0A1M5LW90_9ACTN|nr:S8 family serine peptidase [Jatrophihabitans endophyticus]SHG69317.1 type VII secretion-associated serine protease mycosin [Jatrophihabitans endophyticus]